MPAPLMPPPTTSTSTSMRRRREVMRRLWRRASASRLFLHRHARRSRPLDQTPRCRNAPPICSPSTRARPARARSSSTRDGAHRRAWRSASSARSIPQPGWVEHDPREIWAHAARDARARRSPRPASRRSDIAAHRHHQPARDDGASGTARPASRSHNAIVWQDRRTARGLRRAASDAGLEPLVPRAHRARPRRLLLRHQARLAARPRARRARRAPSAASSPSAPSTPG